MAHTTHRNVDPAAALPPDFDVEVILGLPNDTQTSTSTSALGGGRWVWVVPGVRCGGGAGEQSKRH